MRRFSAFCALAVVGLTLGVWAGTARAADETITDNTVQYFRAFASGTGDWEAVFSRPFKHMTVTAEVADIVIRVYPYRGGATEPVTIPAGSTQEFSGRITGYYLDRTAATYVRIHAQGATS